ncbi:MAG TPA: cytochrome c maturation protein CcmE [Myxococcales bacterium]|nr:cytochrome c maturation protein CcmE [Myxococcales bacterium]HIN85803.1 cytochrome c maturation protein CcmE [Myxococcales bacterium]
MVEVRTGIPSKKGGWGFTLLVVAIVMGGIVLVVQSSTSGGVYDMTIGELLADSGKYVGRGVRVNGVIQAGSFKDNPGDEIDIQFSIGDVEGNQINVRFHQLLPDAFKEGRQVIVLGKLINKQEIECTKLTVKCPSKYKDEGKTDEKAWKSYDEEKKKGAALPVPAEK